MSELCFHVVMYQLAICYERYGFNPAIARDLPYQHLPNFVDIYDNLLKKEAKGKRNKQSMAYLEKLVASFLGSETFFNPHRNKTAIISSRNKWRLLFCYYMSNLKHSLEPALLDGGRLVELHQTKNIFSFVDPASGDEVSKDDKKEAKHILQFLPEQLMDRPNKLSLVEIAGSIFKPLPFSYQFNTDDMDDMDRIKAIAERDWKVALHTVEEVVSSDDDVIEKTGFTPGKIRVSKNFKPKKLNQAQPEE